MILPSYNTGGQGRLLKYEGNVNRMAYFVRWNWSARNYYSDDNENYVPAANVANARNSRIQLHSRSPFTVTIDWGDGTVEQFQSFNSTNSTYHNYVILRSLMYPYYKEGTPQYSVSGDWEYSIPPHHYADDDPDTVRTITVTASEDLYRIVCDSVSMCAFPIIEAASLEYLHVDNTKYIEDIPFDRFQYIPNLTNLLLDRLNSTHGTISTIPESMWNLASLDHLALNGVFDLWDEDACGIRNISKLQSLRSCEICASFLRKYIKEFNDMPNLKSLHIAPGNTRDYKSTSPNGFPSFEEVDAISPNLLTAAFIEYGDVGRTEWPDLSGVGIENLADSGTSNVYHLLDFGATLRSLTTDMPVWIREARSVSRMNWASCFDSQARKDAAVESLYDLVVNWEYVTYTSTASDGKRNQFYGMTVYTYNANYTSSYYRPTGSYQAPDGFEEKASDGNPASPMEMIYVLEKNYGMTIDVVSEADALSAQNYLASHPEALDAPEGGMEESVTGGGNSLIHNSLAPLVAFELFLLSSNLRLREGLCHAVA